MQRGMKLATVAPVIVQLKKVMDRSFLPKKEKYPLFSKLVYKIVRAQKLKALRLVVYNMIHFPLLINIIWTIRRLLVEDSFKNTSFLWIDSLVNIDPYYILPCLTVACYYWNLQRFITKENKDTLVSKLRGYGQILLILWLPFLANWPSGIVLYMLSNALFSVAQSTLLVSPKFLRLVNPKIMLYQFLVRIVEYDKTQSEALIDAIRSGEESFVDKAIQEEVLVEQMKDVLVNLEKDSRKEHDDDDEEENSPKSAADR
eukprot:TRINITY_DN1708_c0_g1_i3.p1 TRINITY_DN1708_c0_g1~~TRINITY_DN1708_c0_g1_i3.p1  ORF type:complete len:258 (-),score=45.95 TRINITY_DN1708_c0_g1_i3:184-957(-)